MKNLWSTYCRDTTGAVTVFVVVMFAFLMAFSGLAFDVARIFNIHSQAQFYVDEVALASAAELDGTTGSINRAIRAAVGDLQHGALVDAGARLSLDDGQDKLVNVESLIFLESITTDPDPMVRSPVTGDVVLCTYVSGAVTCESGITQADADRRASFVLITATTETEKFLLFPIAKAFVPAITTQASVSPQALAGFTREICNFPPMAICNPNESTTAPYGGSFSASAGQQILLQTQGNNSSWAPGDFGFLDLTEVGSNACSGGGADFLRCMLGIVTPNTSCISASVDMNPGQVTSADVGFNVRFDIYNPPFQNKKNDSDFAPDVNVTKGAIKGNPGQCTLSNLDGATEGYTTTVKLPRDSDVSVSNRIGSGVTTAQLQTYWSTNNPTLNGGVLPSGVNTRFKVYEYENSNGIPNFSPTGENGNPSCAPSGITNRRRMVVAVMNCLEHSVQGSSDDVPVISFLDMFLTEPAGDYDDASNHDIFAEVISVVVPGGNDGVLHEYPVLYR